jgi:hypothetical protein
MAVEQLTGESAVDGMEARQSANFLVRIENIGPELPHHASGILDLPLGADTPGPLKSGAEYEVTFSAPPGAHLSFATMFVQSNDLFYAPDGDGIPLYRENGSPVTGDVTSQVFLWDAGTEVNERPGFGENQAPRQVSPDSGEVENGVIQRVQDGFRYPVLPDHIFVRLESIGDQAFRLRIENFAMDPSLLLSPAVWVVHEELAPIFTPGEPDRGEGLEALAEDGDPDPLGALLASRTGAATVLAPGVWALFEHGEPIFTEGESDRGNGLEALAEDGTPHPLADSLNQSTDVISTGVFDTPAGSAVPGPAGPGSAYEFRFQAQQGARLTFATMFVESNDFFYAPDGGGIELYDAEGPLSGDFSSQIYLWDAGTELDQPLGSGANQAPRQSGPNTGADENGVVQRVEDSVRYPLVGVRVTITLER